MERTPLRTVGRLTPLLRWVAGAALITALGGTAGCSTPLDDARLAWADGEGDLDNADAKYREAMNDADLGDLATEELRDIYLELGKTADKSGKAINAEKYFRKAVELDPKSADAYSGLVGALQDLYKFAEALEVAERGYKEADCRNCHRQTAVLLIGRGDAFMQESRWAEAEVDYGKALEIIPDAAIWLAVVRARYAQKDLAGSAKGLKSATELVMQNDLENRRQYLEMRRAVVLLALEQGDVPLADELLDLAPVGVEPEEQVGLAMEVAMEFNRQGKPDQALARLMAIVDAAAGGKLKLTPERLDQIRDQVATIYATRAKIRLGKGDTAGADADIKEALGMRPGKSSLQLQEVLLLAGKRKLTDARAKLAKVETSAKGHKEVTAILAALRAIDYVNGGKLDAAKTELDLAKRNGKDLPEVHVAIAAYLAAKEPSLYKKEKSALRKAGLVKYPGGTVVRAAEALSELDWSRQQLEGLGAGYPYRAPGIEDELESLEKKIKGFYTFPVKFFGEPKAIIVITNQGGAELAVEMVGRSWKKRAKVAPGDTKKVTLKNPGFFEMTYGDKTATFVAEPYTEVTLGL
ncbi:MAG: tetratricopeptide repeat protein [Nannocystales bacterium]